MRFQVGEISQLERRPGRRTPNQAVDGKLENLQMDDSVGKQNVQTAAGEAKTNGENMGVNTVPYTGTVPYRTWI